MPEVIEQTTEEFTNNLKPGFIGAAGIGLGSLLLGPGLGMTVGGPVAGAYVGGTAGTVLTITGLGLGLSSLFFGTPVSGATGGTSSRRTARQGVK